MAQITILNQNNVPQGPFSRSEVAQKLQAGEFTLGSLAFVEGLSQWTALGQVLAKVDSSLPPTPSILPPTAQRYSYAVTMQPPSHLAYAGFWLRFVAIFIDGLIFLPITIIALVLRASFESAEDTAAKAGLAIVLLLFYLFEIVLRWLYFACMESSSWQATLGKKALGIRVTGLDGERISFGRATGRYFGKIISAIIFMIGFIMAGFTERKQALHDMIAGTLVVRE
jgi:uncharacterized RDD family membrane protein YckC